MSGSTIVPVKAALLALWQTTFANQEVTVSYGSRAVISHSAWLVIGNVTGSNDPEALGPRRAMTEEYDVECTLSVGRSGTVDQQQACTERCMSLYAAAELAVRSSASQTLGVTGVLWSIVMGSFTLEEAPASETNGRLNSTYKFNVHVRARYELF